MELHLLKLLLALACRNLRQEYTGLLLFGIISKVESFDYVVDGDRNLVIAWLLGTQMEDMVQIWGESNAQGAIIC